MIGLQEIAAISCQWPDLRLSQCQHFELEEQVFEFGAQVYWETKGDPWPLSSKLPASIMTIRLGQHGSLFLLRDTDQYDTYSSFGSCTEVKVFMKSGLLRDVGAWKPGSLTSICEMDGPVKDPAATMGLIASCVSLINHPRLVRRSPNGSRQQRRALHRGMGFAVDAWTRVSWDISKETVAKVSRDPSFHKVPLHWRRGHFRRAAPHFKGAMQRSDAIRPEDRRLWWQWIEGQWVGHPAFGIKKSVHSPRLSSPKMLTSPTPRPLHVLAH